MGSAKRLLLEYQENKNKTKQSKYTNIIRKLFNPVMVSGQRNGSVMHSITVHHRTHQTSERKKKKRKRQLYKQRICRDCLQSR